MPDEHPPIKRRYPCHGSPVRWDTARGVVQARRCPTCKVVYVVSERPSAVLAGRTVLVWEAKA